MEDNPSFHIPTAWFALALIISEMVQTPLVLRHSVKKIYIKFLSSTSCFGFKRMEK